MSANSRQRIYFPILLCLSDRKCLVVGGGPIARQKVQSLEKFSPEITILAPTVEEQLTQIANRNGYPILRKEYETGDLSGFNLVIAATGNRKLSARIWKECQERGILINAVDDPAHCDFILPATIKRGDLTVSVGTQGKAPFLTREIRRWMNRMFTPEWSEVVNLAAEFRQQVLRRYTSNNQQERQACFARFLEVDWAALLREKKPEELTRLLQGILEGKTLKLEPPPDEGG